MHRMDNDESFKKWFDRLKSSTEVLIRISLYLDVSSKVCIFITSDLLT